MNASLPLPSRPLTVFAAAAKAALWLLLGAWLVLAIAWGTLHGFIVPRIGELRPQLEREAARVLGVPVRIGHVSARSEGLIPTFELEDVVLLDPAGRAALRLPRVMAALSPRSLWNLGFEQLFIDRPELDVRRGADGRIFVAGLDFSRGADNDGRAADWLFRQGEFVIRGGTLRWTDEMRNAPTLALTQVDFVLRNRARRHGVRLDATPPPAWGDRFSLSGQFRQPLLSGGSERWSEWSGQVFASFARIDLSQLRRHVDLGIDIAQGRGALRAWADVERGRVVGGTADVVLTQAQAVLGPDLAPLALNSVSGRLGGRRLAHGFEFETRGLRFETREGQRWPGGNVFVAWTDAEGARPAEGELRADRLDLAALGQIASRLPLGSATHAALQEFAPRGRVDTLQGKWQGPLAAPLRYEMRGKAAGLELRTRLAAPGRAGTPGLRGLDIEFDVTQGGGRARMAMRQGAMELPGVFAEPVLPVDALDAQAQWQVEGETIALTVSQLRFENADAEGRAQLSWRTTPGMSGAQRFPGVLDLQASLVRAEGARVWRYLPLQVEAAARDYVREAVQRGRVARADFKVRGDLREFPFVGASGGEFLVTADVRDAVLAYVPRSLHRGPGVWPALTQLSGELRFQGNGMQVRNAVGRFANAPGLQVRADTRIDDFNTTVVEVAAQVRGPLAEALGYVNGSPVAALLEQALAQATGSGAAEVDLRLALPVAQIERSRVSGTVTLTGNDVQITPDSPMLSRARGAVVFTERGFVLAGVQARALGGDVRIDGGSRAAAPGEPMLQLRAQGTASAEGLRQAGELGFVSRLARDASGAAAYTLGLGFRRGVPEITVQTNLQGLALNLPAPLNKPAEAALPLRYESALTRESALAGPLREQLTVDVGRLGTVRYLRDLDGAQPVVLQGGIALGLAPGEGLAIPPRGVAANIQLAALDVDAWERVLDRLAADVPSAGPARTGAAAASAASASATDYLPTVLAVRARTLDVGGRTLHDVVVGGSREGTVWRANVDALELNGYVEYRQPATVGGSGRLHARLARLAIAASAARDVEALLAQQPASIPALDVTVEDFELAGRRLGRLEIDAVNRGAGGSGGPSDGPREWRLNRLNLALPEARFSATGNWAALAAPAASTASAVAPAGAAAGRARRTVMNFRLDIADSGQLLARFGMGDLVRGARGRMEGQVAWLGSPLALDYPSLSGRFAVAMEDGQFLKAEPGIAKLLGVLSLQSLPRRLALDFRDVFSEGFAFDFVRGDVTIEQGIASTNNLQMKGVNAAVLMDGRADIARETQDIKVVIVPEINAGTASLVASVINPAVGLGTFLAQLFLRQPLMRAATQEFHIDGTWADPRVTRVSRTGAAAEPAAANENR